MDFDQCSKNIIEVGSRVYNNYLTHGTGGNISFKISDDCILITRTGTNLGNLQQEDIVKIDIEGHILSDRKDRKTPSSEMLMHLKIYRRNLDICAIIHAHPPFSTSFAVAGIPLEESILPEVTNTVGLVPVISYQKPHSQVLADNVAEAIKHNKYVFMANHGILGAGVDLLNICNNLENIEFLCKVIIYSKILGNINKID
ncbi:MAG TPA: class II aldolase/adducin family protein [Atribacterota bacterium]|nr:class II aldolase/adducin family protein [Atribacterota bacterium]